MDIYNYLHKTGAVILFYGGSVLELESRTAALGWITVVNVKFNIG